MSQHFDIAILGVDTLGGETLLELLEEREFPVATLYPLVSQEGELESVRFAGRTLSVESAAEFDWSQVQLAFSSNVPPNAVPTTLVLDRQGRVAARVLGQITEASILQSLIDTVAKEKS